MRLFVSIRLAGLTSLLAAPALLTAQDARPWWSPGDGAVLPAAAEFGNVHGRFGLLSTAGDLARCLERIAEN